MVRKDDALQLLKEGLNQASATFRKDQWEAIDKIVNEKKRLLLVERTGWGKSSVYFISTKLLRGQGKGLTIIISPLLALMRNQIEAAARFGLQAFSINSTNLKEWDHMRQKVLENEVDVLLISPERLANASFVAKVLQPISNNVGLFVVDEAHCISDWGHDFRPDYRRIVNILKFMPEGMPILSTTATANDRVCDDIVSQLGNIEVIRGPLIRKSLVLQNIPLENQITRLAWLKEQVPQLPGSGIIYTLTKRDAQLVTRWLLACGIRAAYYYSGATNAIYADSNVYRQVVEDALYNNEVKVVVATSALGMGYDKPDLGFVIHYQAPSSIIAYYQQVGRAGRAIDKAYGILLSGEEDEVIHNYFRINAFPPEERVEAILELLDRYDGLTVNDLMNKLNLHRSQIEQALKFLQVEENTPIMKIESSWYRTPIHYIMDVEKIKRLTSRREMEWQEIQHYITSSHCLMNHLQGALDDPSQEVCSRCANCSSENRLPHEVRFENSVEAASFLKHSAFEFKLKIQIPAGALTKFGFKGRIKPAWRGENGRSLSRWEDAGWGQKVVHDLQAHHLDDALVEAFVQMIEEWHPEPYPTWVTCVPSWRKKDLLPDFCKRVACKLGLPFCAVLQKNQACEPQADQGNSYHKCKNLDGAFALIQEANAPVQSPGLDVVPGKIVSSSIAPSSMTSSLRGSSVKKGAPVLLIDDFFDSAWTLTLCSALLRKAGCGPVFPCTLTSTSVS